MNRLNPSRFGERADPARAGLLEPRTFVQMPRRVGVADIELDGASPLTPGVAGDPVDHRRADPLAATLGLTEKPSSPRTSLG